jgi:hypothetical protein
VYSDVFDILPRKASRVPASRRSGLTYDADASFQLVDNDFTIAQRKVAGNAQCVTKGRWLQHTSFLWDFRPERMDVLKEPKRRPEYRGQRKHHAFLAPLVSFGFERAAMLDTIEDAFEARGFSLVSAGTAKVHACKCTPRLACVAIIDKGSTSCSRLLPWRATAHLAHDESANVVNCT